MVFSSTATDEERVKSSNLEQIALVYRQNRFTRMQKHVKSGYFGLQKLLAKVKFEKAFALY